MKAFCMTCQAPRTMTKTTATPTGSINHVKGTCATCGGAMSNFAKMGAALPPPTPPMPMPVAPTNAVPGVMPTGAAKKPWTPFKPKGSGSGGSMGSAA